MRLEIEAGLADGLGKVRALVKSQGWVPGIDTEAPAGLRTDELEGIEREFGIVIPTPIRAYIASGCSLWGDGPLALWRIRELTLDLRDQVGAHEVYADAAERLKDVLIVDDDSNGNYIGIEVDDDRSPSAVLFIDHEAFHEPSPIELGDAIERYLENYGDSMPEEYTPFVVELLPPPSTDEPPATYVVHVSFGRGKVVEENGDNLTIEFDTAGTKKLKRSYVRPLR